MTLCVMGAAAGACAALVGAAGAQAIETIDFTVVWDKAAIAPGETNTGHVIATIGPEIGSIVAWNTPPGTGQLGTLLCFGLGKLDFVNSQNGELGAIDWSFPAEFVVSSMGTKNGFGGIDNLAMWQHWNHSFPPNYGQWLPILNVSWKAPDNPAPMPYGIEYKTNIISAKVALDVGLGDWVYEKAVFTNGMGGFVVTPAPAGFALIGVAAGWTSRRRR